MPDVPSNTELKNVASILHQLTPGTLPFEIFHEVARLGVFPIVEVVPLRLTADKQVEILLIQREADDPVWPDQLHVPGTVVRASDTVGSYADAFTRVATELRDTQIKDPVFVQNILHHSGRGMESSQIYWVEVTGEPKTGAFYNTESLPKNLVQSQLDFIPHAIAAFKRAH